MRKFLFRDLCTVPMDFFYPNILDKMLEIRGLDIRDNKSNLLSKVKIKKILILTIFDVES